MILEISKETRDEVFNKIIKHLEKKRVEKGRNSFSSLTDIYSKISEEQFEVLKELHAKDKDKFADELLDLAAVCLWGYMSKVEWDKNGLKGFGK